MNAGPLDGVAWIAAPVDWARLPIFRRECFLDAPVVRAELLISGLGHFEARINGQKVGDHEMSPAWTDYRKTCLFVRHEVTAMISAGANAIGVMLGNGMYHVAPPADGHKRYRKFKGSFGRLRLIARLSMEYADGARSQLDTGADWRCAPGPIAYSCIYGGEDFDQRSEPIDWDRPGFDDSDWRRAEPIESPGGELIEQRAPPVRVMQTLRAVSRRGDVFDLGCNFAGHPEVTVRGPAGATVRLLTGERLDADGQVSQKNTGSPVYFTFTKRTQDPQTWRPKFSYTGFRYVQARWDDPEVDVEVRGQFLHADAPVAGGFECSVPLLNRIHDLILAAIRSNMQGVLTDCPHREKLGWLEQTHLMGPSILWNFDAAGLYAKISRDMRDAQSDDGCIPTIAPRYTTFAPPWDVFNDSPEWGSAVVFNPWMIYRRTGDRSLIDENYDTMRRYVAYLDSRRGADGIIAYGLGDWYDVGEGDPGFGKLTTLGLTATAVYYDALRVLSWSAKLLGRFEEADACARAADQTRAAFNARFFDAPRGCYDTGSQTAQAMPLALGLVEDAARPGVLDRLVEDIGHRGDHFSAGDIGLKFVLDALAEAGRSDVILACLMRTDPPSYGAQLAAGATTLTEAWDANPKVSQNHMMLGHAEAWFYEHLAGIRVDFTRPPSERITIAPAGLDAVESFDAWHECRLGRITVRKDKSRLKIMLPVDGTVKLPNRPAQTRWRGTHTFDL